MIRSLLSTPSNVVQNLAALTGGIITRTWSFIKRATGESEGAQLAHPPMEVNGGTYGVAG